MERLGRYALLEPLGEGGMARVFIARRDGSNEICVLKRMHAHIEANDLASKRFHREAHIASLFSHPAIARVLDAGLEGDSFCIAMEHIAGQTVEQILLELQKNSRLLTLEHALFIAEQTLEALAYAHDFLGEDGRPLNIVHRDLSPRNIMASYAGAVKVIDFGIARGDVDGLKTAPGVLMGTPYYMSPEQARTVAVDRRSDLYTLGAVLFEMFTNRRLVRAKGRAAILAEVSSGTVAPISSIDPRVPKSFDPFFARVLAKDPAGRPADARAMLAELRAAAGPLRASTSEELAGLMRELFPVQATSERTAVLSLAEPTRLETLRSGESSTPALTAPPPRERGGRLLLLALGGALTAALIGIAGASFFREEQAPIAAVAPAVARVEAQRLEPPRVTAKTPEEEPPPEPARVETVIERTAVPKDRPPPKKTQVVEQTPASIPPPKQTPSRLAEVEAALAALRASPSDADLRARLYDRIEQQSRALDERRRRVIRAAIDRSLLDSGIEGLERGVQELRKAEVAGEL